MAKVKVYLTSQCPRCRVLKEQLKRMGVEFEELSLEDTDVMTDLIMRNAFVFSAPSIEIAGMVFEYRGGA